MTVQPGLLDLAGSALSCLLAWWYISETISAIRYRVGRVGFFTSLACFSWGGLVGLQAIMLSYRMWGNILIIGTAALLGTKMPYWVIQLWKQHQDCRDSIRRLYRGGDQ